MIDPRKARGEMVLRTIFFSDMRGFTRMSERESPDNVFRTLGRCLGIQVDGVRKHGGRLDKLVGDGIAALFDGPDMALEAVRCATEIQQAIGRENREHPDEPRLEVGIGIVTGQLAVGNIGTDDPADFAMAGPNVKLCSGLCDAAAAGQTLISGETFRALADRIQATPEEIELSGFGSVRVYRIAV